MKSENFYIIIFSLWATFVVSVLAYLYNADSLRYYYIFIPIYIILFYLVLSKNTQIQHKKKSAIYSSIALGIFLIYSLIVFYITKESFRTKFFVYALPFLILEFGLMFLYRRYRPLKGMKTNHETKQH